MLFRGCVHSGPQRSAVQQAVTDIRAKADERREAFGAEGHAFWHWGFVAGTVTEDNPTRNCTTHGFG